jgi:hypothetical protein
LPIGHGGVTIRAVTLIAELLTISDPTDRATAANDQLWKRPGHARDLRETRRQAIREALDQGQSPEALAEQLRVRSADLVWMAS